MLKLLWEISQTNRRVQGILANLFYYLSNNYQRVRGVGNTVCLQGAFLKRVHIKIIGDNNTLIIGRGSRVSNTKILIWGSSHRLEIGSNCIYGSGSLWFEDSNCQISIGENTIVYDAQIAAIEPQSKIRIGKDCLLSNGIEIRSSDSHSIIDLETQTRINHAEDIHIGNHVWIGAHTRILKGVSIGADSIIGTDSVVTRSIPCQCIAAGVPARILRENVTWQKERIYS